MVLGAFVGGVLLRWVATPAPLWLASAVLVTCASLAYRSARSPGSGAWR
jgi:predicted MFS family arabinose efflux permease